MDALLVDGAASELEYARVCRVVRPTAGCAEQYCLSTIGCKKACACGAAGHLISQCCIDGELDSYTSSRQKGSEVGVFFCSQTEASSA